MSFIKFKIGGIPAEAVDATSDVTTDAYRFNNSHDWSVSINDIGVVGGPPTYTLEVSNNKTKWYELNPLSNDVNINDSVENQSFSFQYVRVVYSANGTTAGTVDIELSLLNDKF